MTDFTNFLGYPFRMNIDVIMSRDLVRDNGSVEREISLLVSPVKIACLEEIEPWLSQGVMH